MGSLDRKLRKKLEAASPAGLARAKNDESTLALCKIVEQSKKVATLVRDARRVLRCGPLDCVLPCVHVSQTGWLNFFDMSPGGGGSVLLPREDYMADRVFYRFDLEGSHPTAKGEMGSAFAQALRIRPQSMSLILVVHADGTIDSEHYEPFALRADASQVFEEYEAGGDNDGYDLGSGADA